MDDDSEDLKARIQELEDELQKLKEEKRQDGTDSATVDEEIEEVHDQIRDEADQSGMSRRKFMKAIAGGGAALGAAAMMPSATALDIESNNPLSYNGDLSVDTQGNIDLHGNNISNAGSIVTDKIDTENITNDVGDAALQAAWDGLVVPVANGVGMDSAIDPQSTSTPIQDAIDIVNANGITQSDVTSGAILLPPTRVDEHGGEVTGLGGIKLIGFGVNASIIRFTDLEADGFSIESQDDGSFAYLDQLTISGGNRDERTSGSALHFTEVVDHFDMGKVRFENWGGSDPVIWQDTGNPFTSVWENIEIRLCRDASAIRMEEAGTEHYIGLLDVSLQTTDRPLFVNNPSTNVELIIDTFSASGSSRGFRVSAQVQNYVEIGSYHHEAVETFTQLCDLSGDHHFRLNHAHIDLTGVDDVIDLIFTPGNYEIGFIETAGTTVNNAKIRVSDDTVERITYHGPSNEVDNNIGSVLSEEIHCLGDGVYKASTGKGHDGGTEDTIYGP